MKSQFAWMRINIFCGHVMPNLGKDLPESSGTLILFSSGKRKAHAREVPQPNGSSREGWKEQSSRVEGCKKDYYATHRPRGYTQI